MNKEQVGALILKVGGTAEHIENIKYDYSEFDTETLNDEDCFGKLNPGRKYASVLD